MATIMKHGGKACSIPAGLAIAACTSMLVTLTASAAIASSLNAEKISWEQAGYWIMGMLFAASFIGSKSAFIAIKRQKLVITLLSGILYWGLLLCITALFFGGNFGAVWETAGIIVAGCASASLLSLPNVKKNRSMPGRSYR